MFGQETNNESSVVSNAAAIKVKNAMDFETAGKYESALIQLEKPYQFKEIIVTLGF